jgi:hypothetical protein
MTLERKVRALAGSLVLVGLFFWLVWSPYWLFLDLFVGLNLLQSAFTGFCPAEKILARLGTTHPKTSQSASGPHPAA